MSHPAAEVTSEPDMAALPHPVKMIGRPLVPATKGQIAEQYDRLSTLLASEFDEEVLEDAIEDALSLLSRRGAERTEALHMAVYAAQSQLDASYANWEAIAAAEWFQRDILLSDKGVGHFGALDPALLAQDPEAAIAAIQYAVRNSVGSDALQIDDLRAVCGDPENFDEYVEKILAPLGFDAAGLQDWGHVCGAGPSAEPHLEIAGVQRFIQSPLEAMNEYVQRRHHHGRFVAPPRHTHTALAGYRFTRDEFNSLEVALKDGTVDHDLHIVVAVATFKSIRRGYGNFAARAWRSLPELWQGAVYDALAYENIQHCENLNAALEGKAFTPVT